MEELGVMNRLFGLANQSHKRQMLLVIIFSVPLIALTVGYGAEIGMRESLAILLSFILIILTHELGHMVSAYAHGLEIRDFFLIPLAGMGADIDIGNTKYGAGKVYICVIMGPLVTLIVGFAAVPFCITYHDVVSSVVVCVAGMFGLHNLFPIPVFDGEYIFQSILKLRRTQAITAFASWVLIFVGSVLMFALPFIV